jgi:putative tryptophan/tyrosine transport system substrate-binding protein
MKRRAFITLLGGAAATSLWPLAAQAQGVRRIGVLLNGDETSAQTQARRGAFERGLAALGWTDRNMHIDYRYIVGDAGRARAAAAELVALAPEVILSAPPGLRPLQELTRTIPIVFAVLVDPVGTGFVTSLNRPGGNMTGFAAYDLSSDAKYLQMLKDVAPRIDNAAFLYNPVNPGLADSANAFVAAGPLLGLKVAGAPVRNVEDIKQSVEAVAREGNGALLLANNTPIVENLGLILGLATPRGIPTLGFYRYFPAAGTLMSYGFDDVDQFREAATYVDRILKGAKPADLPVQYPTKYQLVINLKTAKALGLTISRDLLLVADEVIE